MELTRRKCKWNHVQVSVYWKTGVWVNNKFVNDCAASQSWQDEWRLWGSEWMVVKCRTTTVTYFSTVAWRAKYWEIYTFIWLARNRWSEIFDTYLMPTPSGSRRCRFVLTSCARAATKFAVNCLFISLGISSVNSHRTCPTMFAGSFLSFVSDLKDLWVLFPAESAIAGNCNKSEHPQVCTVRFWTYTPLNW